MMRTLIMAVVYRPTMIVYRHIVDQWYFFAGVNVMKMKICD